MQNWAESHSGATASVAHHKFKGGRKKKKKKRMAALRKEE